MAKYEVDYKSVTGVVKRDKAIEDIKQYLCGTDVWDKLLMYTVLAVAGDTPSRQIHLAFGMKGIEGYPVEAVIDLVKATMREFGLVEKEG